MVTISQLIRKGRNRKNRYRYKLCPALEGCPFKLGVCRKVYTIGPKKPNSAVRKIAKVRVQSTGRFILARIPGQSHNLRDFSVVLIRGGKANDMPGVHYTLVKGKYDFSSEESFARRKSLSKYGIINPLKNK